MRITHTFKEHSKKKVMYKDHALGKRIWELEGAFNEAVNAKDHWHAEYYNREIAKIYNMMGIKEN